MKVMVVRLVLSTRLVAGCRGVRNRVILQTTVPFCKTSLVFWGKGSQKIGFENRFKYNN